MMTAYSQHSHIRSIRLFVAACLVILAGLALRRNGYAIGLPFVIVKYGGSLLWGSMVYLLVATVMGGARGRLALTAACALAVFIELARLVHFPTLDAFQTTTAGALLLGRVFSLWNIACYLSGIGLAALIASRCEKP